MLACAKSPPQYLVLPAWDPRDLACFAGILNARLHCSCFLLLLYLQVIALLARLDSGAVQVLPEVPEGGASQQPAISMVVQDGVQVRC